MLPFRRINSGVAGPGSARGLKADSQPRRGRPVKEIVSPIIQKRRAYGNPQNEKEESGALGAGDGDRPSSSFKKEGDLVFAIPSREGNKAVAIFPLKV
jgi:hypothetical protein